MSIVANTTSNHADELMAKFSEIKSIFRFLAVLALIFTVSTTLQAQDTVDFELPDVDGTVHRLSDYRGKWVIVNFWATWCGPCIREIPMLREVAKMTDPVQPVVIGIDFEEIPEDLLRSAMETLNMDYLVLRVGNSPLIPFEPLKGLPSTFIVSPDGRLVFSHAGEIHKRQLVETLQKLVESS